MTSKEDWTTMWNVFDQNQVGSLPQVDVKHIMRSLGHRHTEAEFRDLFKPLGESITFEEFLHLMEQPYKGPTEEDLLTALHAFDTNGSGKLNFNELVSLLSTLGEKIPEAEVRQILHDCPVASDGTVDIEHLTTFLVEPVSTVTPEIQELERQLAKSYSS